MNILAFFAHPDDETMLCGGILALAARHARLSILCATRGEGGEMGEPPLCERAELAAVREQELRCAAQALGAAKLEILSYIDPTVGEDNTLYPFTPDEERLAQEVAQAIRQEGADVLISHGSDGEYGHPAHKLCHRAALRALQLLGEAAPMFYTSLANYPGHPNPRLANADDPAHLILDLGPYQEVKTAAAECHRTQHALFVRAASKEAGRLLSVPEVIGEEESLHRVFPPLAPGTPSADPFAQLVREHCTTRENPDHLHPQG